MAGDWLKIEANLPEKEEVLSITASMGWDDCDLTVGKLFKLWRWFDQQTTDGNARRVTTALLDRIVGVSGFCEAMREVGWLDVDGSGVTLPKFERHNGSTAKSRALTAKRVAKHKGNAPSNAPSNAEGNAHTVTGPLPREEKRREDKTIGKSIVSGNTSRDRGDDFIPKDAAEWLSHFKRNHGFEADPTSVKDRKKLWPVFASWTKAGLTAGFVDAAVKAAHERSREPIACLPLYVDRLMASDQAARASPTKSFQDRNAETIAALTGRDRDHEPDNRTVDV
ncbi:MAG TPA: hypothetical protein VJR26_09945 [Candidatus Acidoferrales bacterium]|nr:hypothetical protein [Candidatus Acidoferrales bacterium]